MSISHWPCIPAKLTDFMDNKLIRFVIAGVSEEHGLPLSIVEPDGRRHDPYDSKQNYRPFCKKARYEIDVDNGMPVFFGFDENCRDWDKSVADTYFNSPNYEQDVPYPHPCWMQLLDYIVLEETGGYHYAIFTGQYIQEIEGEARVDLVHTKVDHWATNNKFSDQHKIAELKDSLRGHLPATKHVEQEIRASASRIKTSFDTYWRKHRQTIEDGILKDLYNGLGRVQTVGSEPDWDAIDLVLENLRTKIGCAHIMIFAAETRRLGHSTSEHSNILMLRSSAGLPRWNREAPPHFNWKKAELPPDGKSVFDPTSMDPIWKRAIRCDNVPEPPPSTLFRAFGDRAHGMRCVIVLGQIEGLARILEAQEFLTEVSNLVCERIRHLMLVASLEHSQGALREERDFLAHQVKSRLATFEDYQRAIDDVFSIKSDLQSFAPPNEAFVLARRDLADHTELVQRGTILFHDPTGIKAISTNIIPVLEAAIDEKETRAELSEIEIRRQYNAINPPPPVEVDAFWLKTLFIHLLDNSIKYTRTPRTGGKRWIAVRAYTEGIRLIIEIENFGLGILAENLEKIFEKGSRIVGGTRFEQKPGMGRGLFEARGIAHAMNAEITAQSRHHKGRRVTPDNINECITCFRITFPLTRREI